MCNINTEAMNRRLITNTGTGPLEIRREGMLALVIDIIIFNAKDA
jgi:hypothetical protein